MNGLRSFIRTFERGTRRGSGIDFEPPTWSAFEGVWLHNRASD